MGAVVAWDNSICGSLVATNIAGWCHQLTGTIIGEVLVAGHGTRDGKAMIATLRHRLIAIPARLIRHAGQLIVRPAPAGHDLLTRVLTAIRMLPAPH